MLNSLIQEISQAYKKLTSEGDSSDEEEYEYSPTDIITELFGQFFSSKNWKFIIREYKC